MSTNLWVGIIGAGVSLILGIPAFFAMRGGPKKKIPKALQALLCLAVFILGFAACSFLATSFVPKIEELPLRSLRFEGSVLELSPAQPQLYRRPVDGSEGEFEGLARIDYVLVNIYDKNEKLIFKDRASMQAGDTAAVSLTKLKPGTYTCIFFGMRNDPDEPYYYLYYNPNQFFRWNGKKGAFVS